MNSDTDGKILEGDQRWWNPARMLCDVCIVPGRSWNRWSHYCPMSVRNQGLCGNGDGLLHGDSGGEEVAVVPQM